MTEWWADVPAARALPAARRAAERAQLVALVARPVRSRVGRPLVLAASGLALASATGAAYAFFGTDEPTSRLEVECHTTVEAARGVSFAGAGTSVVNEELGADPELRDLEPAIAACADLWAQGVLRLGAENAQLPTGEVEEVPPLTVCVTEFGAAAVFPTDEDVCAGLGLRAVQS